jgi:hypothetical protein
MLSTPLPIALGRFKQVPQRSNEVWHGGLMKLLRPDSLASAVNLILTIYSGNARPFTSVMVLAKAGVSEPYASWRTEPATANAAVMSVT